MGTSFEAQLHSKPLPVGAVDYICDMRGTIVKSRGFAWVAVSVPLNN